MTGDGENSVTQWLGDLKAGNRDEASRRLWERYFPRLAHYAQGSLRAADRGAADGEDIALSVFDCFFQGIATGRFPDFGNRDDLWRLLVTITARKAHNQRRDESRQKRGGGRVLGEGALAGADPAGDQFMNGA